MVEKTTLEELVESLTTALTGRRKQTDLDGDDLDFETTGDTSNKRALLNRLSEVTRARKAERQSALEEKTAILAQVEGLIKGIETFKSETASSVADGIKARDLVHDDDLALVGMGVSDPTGRRTMRQVRAAAPEAERGDNISSWWEAQVKAQQAFQADPEKAADPGIARVLTPYLPAPDKANDSSRPGGYPRGVDTQTAAPTGLAEIDTTLSPAEYFAAAKKLG